MNIDNQSKRFLRQEFLRGLNIESASTRRFLKKIQDLEMRKLRIQNLKEANKATKNDKLSTRVVIVPSGMLEKNGSFNDLVEHFHMIVTNHFWRGDDFYVSDGNFAVCLDNSFEMHNDTLDEILNELREGLESARHRENNNTFMKLCYPILNTVHHGDNRVTESTGL